MDPLEFIYYAGYSLDKSLGLRKRKRLPHTVISVGNITTGGTGKTPLVITLAEKAYTAGYLPCILTRGYKGTGKGTLFVSRGAGPILTPAETGDEPYLMSLKLKSVPIIKGPDRYEAGIFALRSLPDPGRPYLFILDDGFQHWGLFRDSDIVLIDSANPFGNRKLLPTGILREPLKELSRADMFVIKQVSSDAGRTGITDIIGEIRTYNSAASVYKGIYRPTGLRTLTGEPLPLDSIAGRPVCGFCGIGNPASFRDLLGSMHADIRDFMAFSDHHSYTCADFEGIARSAERCSADWIVTTEKDIIKIADLQLPKPLLSVAIEFSIEEGFFKEILPMRRQGGTE